MQIYNFKINKNLVFKGILLLFILICIFILIFSGFKLFKEMKNFDTENFTVNDSYFEDNQVTEISSENYTNVLKEVHDNIDEYVGKEISFVGYIYKIDYLEKNQFVLARNMIINPANQTVIVGFLSEYDSITEFDNYTWVKVTGRIEKGNLNGPIPIINVENIEKTEKPEVEFVYPPDDTYIPTSATF